MKTYSLLKSDPALVRKIYPDSQGDIDLALEQVTAKLETVKQGNFDYMPECKNSDFERFPGKRALEMQSISIDVFCRTVFKYGSLERDLPGLIKQADAERTGIKRVNLIRKAIEYDYQELLLDLLPRWPLSGYEQSFIVAAAFRHRRFHTVDILTSPPWNMRPSSQHVLEGGRMEDLERYGNIENIRRQPVYVRHSSLSRASPAVFDFWYQAMLKAISVAVEIDEFDMTPPAEEFVDDYTYSQQRLDETLMEVFSWLLQEPNLELLEHLERTYPDMTAKFVTAAVEREPDEDSDPNPGLSGIINTGNVRLIGVVFRCLDRHQNP